MEVALDQPRRYAEASLDDNPIHLDPEVAKMGGLPGVILHGLCTMAFCSRHFVEGACGGDPRRLKRLAVRFSKPVLPGQTLTTTAWKTGEQGGVSTYGFETANPEGALVVTNGVAEVAGA
jgi:acyl dehydratase